MAKEKEFEDICILMTEFFLEISRTKTIIIALEKLIYDEEYSKKDISNVFDILSENYSRIEEKFKEFESKLLK